MCICSNKSCFGGLLMQLAIALLLLGETPLQLPELFLPSQTQILIGVGVGVGHGNEHEDILVLEQGVFVHVRGCHALRGL